MSAKVTPMYGSKAGKAKGDPGQETAEVSTDTAQAYQAACGKWAKINVAHTLLALLKHELPEQMRDRIDAWIDAVDTIREACRQRGAVLTSMDCDVIGNWLNDICSDCGTVPLYR